MKRSVSGQVGPGEFKVVLELHHAAVEEGNWAEAAVDRVTEAGLSLVGEGVDGVFTVFLRDLAEDLADVAGPKYLMDLGKLLGLVGPEVGREYAAWAAPPL